MSIRILSSIIVGAIVITGVCARDSISIAGSSTVLPFATIIAERMGRNPSFKTPVVESGGSSVGKKRVCEGIGTEFTDIGNASSQMKPAELSYCNDNGIKLTQIKVGYDGIVLANSRKGQLLKISLHDLGKALTAKVPDPKYSERDNLGTMIDNPYKLWSEVNPALPAIAIKVMGPPTTSGTRASFAEIVNEKNYCKKNKKVKALEYPAKKCRAMRTDGVYIEAGEQDNLIVQNLQNDPSIYGIFGFSYLDQNSDTLQGAELSGVMPTFEAIADGSYKASRALWFYVKHQHVGVIPGIAEYMQEWTKHWDNDGILAEAGMIPMSEVERDRYAVAMKDLPLLTIENLKK